MDNYAQYLYPLYVPQEAFPARLKGMHVVNEPGFFDMIYAIAKQFMKDKMKKRVSISPVLEIVCQ